MTQVCNAKTSQPGADSAATAIHDARDLVQDGTTTRIRLDGQTYTLRITRAGKLILTK